MESVGGEWLRQIDPEVVELVVRQGRQIEREFGGLRCRLARLCSSHSAAILAVEAAASGMRPADVLRYCIVCKTDAKTVFDRLIKCVEVRGGSYLFIVSTRGGMELWLLYSGVEDVFEGLNEILAEHHNIAIDDSHFEEFKKLIYERAARCDFSITYDG
jgi:tRNA threonylcarbamoyladenosine modification (KEOPS) complex Cgi121 subunit